MTLSPRRKRLAAIALAATAAFHAHAQSATQWTAPSTPAPAARPKAQDDATTTPPRPSAMTGGLFYEVLLGELTARTGEAGDGFQLMLDAAKRTRDPQLFERAAEIALQARSGDAALTAVQAWKKAIPDSREARRFELQVLIAMGRIGETAEPLRAELAATPQAERPLLMAAIARSYARARDKKLAVSTVEQAFADELKSGANVSSAWGAIGRVRLAADDTTGALEAAQKGQQADPAAVAPVLLALDLVGPNQPLAEPIVKHYLDTPDARPEIRMAYARTLTSARRYADATAQLRTLTTQSPQMPQPWLLLGGLQAQMRQDAEAQTSVKRYLDLENASKNAANADADADFDEVQRARALAQAYFLLAQLAERHKDYAGADAWLARIDSGEDLATAQVQRATLLVRQGKLAQAREMVQALPEIDEEDKQVKFRAEVQLLREAGQYQAAYDMLAQASAAAPTDIGLLYDQAMMAEKLKRLDEMERLLRRLIELKPDSHNAYNALGYSLADRNVRLPEARELIRKAVSLAPDDPFIIDSLGWVEYRLGNAGEATRLLEDAYKRRPDPEIGAHLGEVLWSGGQRGRAMTVWKEAQAADADNEVLQETLKRLRVKP